MRAATTLALLVVMTAPALVRVRWHVFSPDSSSELPIALCGRHVPSGLCREWSGPIERACRFLCSECLDGLFVDYRTEPRQDGYQVVHTRPTG
jgi:hypothetical protein